MEKKGRLPLLSIFAVSLLCLGFCFVLFSFYPSLFLTGYSIYDPNAFTLSFVSPTPISGASLESNNFTLNITSSTNLSYAWLSWNGINESLNGADQNWYLQKQGSGQFTYLVYGNLSNGTYTSTESRTITLSNVTINLNLTNSSTPEDFSFEQDLWNFTTSSKSASQLLYELFSQTNTSVLNCEIRTNRYLNCTPVLNQNGFSDVGIKSSYQSSTSNITLLVNVTPVNDPPTLTQLIPNQTFATNETHIINLGSYFTDVENDSLNYSSTNPEHVQIIFNGKLASLTALDSFVGISNLSFNASDGKNYTLSNTFFLNVTALDAGPIPNVTLPVINQASFTIPDQQWNRNTDLKLDFSSYLTLPATPSYSVTGLSSIKARFEANNAILTPDKDWVGTEKAIFKVTSGPIEYTSNEVSLKVSDANRPPTLKTEIPAINFTENNTQVIIDLNDYFQDPDGDTLEYKIGESEGINATLSTKSIVILSLATSPTEITTETIQISAKDPYGGSVTDDLLITVAESLRKTQFQLSWLLYFFLIAIAGTLLVVAYKKRQTFKLPSFNTTSSGASDENWMSHLFSNMMKKEEKPTGKFRTESYYLKEALAVLDALVASTDDKLARQAIVKEKEKLVKAYNVLKEGLADENIRKEILYLREVKASLLEIKAVSNDKLIRDELGKEIEILNKVLKSFFQQRETIVHPLRSSEKEKTL